MHPNPAFRKTDTARNLDFARMRGFGVLCVNGADGPVLAHVPFVMAADGEFLDLHLARSNLVIAAGLPTAAVMAVSGPDHYISPDWYGIADQVPTWNYIAVHLRGVLSPMPPETLEPHLDQVSALHEAGLAPKPAWTSAKMTDGVMARMMRMILPFRLTIASVDGTWKLNQNKPLSARQGVIAALSADSGIARAMKDLPEP
ncbi:MAG: FMN-binding negative transcriptional regulator [Alphaproteobacteria bacterium]|jgi:transcriptional regulator